MRRMCSIAVLVAAVLAASAAGSPAEEPWQPVQLTGGMRELSLWGALDVRESDGLWLWLAGDVGFMLGPRHEIGPSFNVQTWIFDWETVAAGACGGFYRYNLQTRTGRVVPFVGLRGLGYLGGDREWDAEARVEAGMWHFLGEGLAINVTGFYGRRFGPRCEPWACPEDEDHTGLSAGVSVFF